MPVLLESLVPFVSVRGGRATCLFCSEKGVLENDSLLFTTPYYRVSAFTQRMCLDIILQTISSLDVFFSLFAFLLNYILLLLYGRLQHEASTQTGTTAPDQPAALTYDTCSSRCPTPITDTYVCIRTASLGWF